MQETNLQLVSYTNRIWQSLWVAPDSWATVSKGLMRECNGEMEGALLSGIRKTRAMSL